MGAIERMDVSHARMPAVARILARYDRAQLAAFIEIAIELADTLEGDPDIESSAWPEDIRAVDLKHLPEDAEAAGDESDAAWHEWSTMHPKHRRYGACRADVEGNEDDEPDDHAEDDDPAGQCDEDGINTVSSEIRWQAAFNGEPGCPISDPDADWPQTSNVPMIEAVTLDYNIFNDKRTPLGLVNLQSSFRVGDEGIRSADSGNIHVSRDLFGPLKPGTPV